MFSCRYVMPGSSWSVLALSLLLYVTQISGQRRVIGSPERIVVAAGEDAVLPCRLEPALDVRELTVEWSRDDLRPRTSDKYVHIYRDGGELPAMKIRAYGGRTALSPTRLQDGDMALTIRNVTASDQGRYCCFVPTLRDPTLRTHVELLVEQHVATTTAAPTTTTPTILPTPAVPTDPRVRVRVLVPVLVSVLVLVLVLVLAVGLILKRRKQNLLKYDPAPNKTPPPSPPPSRPLV